MIALLMLTVGTPALAAGFGVSLTFGNSDGEWTFDDGFTDLDLDVDISYKRVAFLLDTGPLSDRLLNYRLNAGLVVLESDFGFTGEIDLAGVFTSHTWGFKLFASESLRVWAGPQLRTAFYVGELENSPVSNDVVNLDLGVGGAVGVNFGIGDHVTLGVEAGYASTFTFGVVTFDDFGDDVDIYGQDDGIYLALSVVFGR
jgi:hypothetical protein